MEKAEDIERRKLEDDAKSCLRTDGIFLIIGVGREDERAPTGHQQENLLILITFIDYHKHITKICHQLIIPKLLPVGCLFNVIFC